MKTETHDVSLVLTVAEAAVAPRLSPNSIRKAIREGHLHALRFGGRRFLIPRAELEKMLGQIGERD